MAHVFTRREDKPSICLRKQAEITSSGYPFVDEGGLFLIFPYLTNFQQPINTCKMQKSNVHIALPMTQNSSH